MVFQESPFRIPHSKFSFSCSLSLTLSEPCVRVPSVLHENLALVQQRIHQACQRSGRDPASVTLVCVTKGIPADRIQEAVASGVRDVGENRVQEAREKQHALGRRPEAGGPSSNAHSIRWHLIGSLQRNKAGSAVEIFDLIHSVDSLPLIEELERQAGKRVRTVEVLLQVNVSGEVTKHGCSPNEVLRLAEAIRGARCLTLVGLMTMAPLVLDPEAARPHFRRLRTLRDELALAFGLRPSALRLSMGMSNDFEVAIEEGATLVRIGTAIFQTGDRRPETGR